MLKGLLAGMLAMTAACAPASAAYDSGNVLSNGDFEKGDLSEVANNAVGAMPWMTGNKQNKIAAGKDFVHGGAYSLAWTPIGWNVKDDGTTEDAGAFILNQCRQHLDAGADTATISGFANTEKLNAKYKLVVVLSNDTFTTVDYKTVLDGGVAGWQPFKAKLPIKKSDNAVIVAFTISGTKGVGAPESAVYLDDLSLAYTGGGDAKSATPASASGQPAPANALSNGGFEKGDLSEAANNHMGNYPWLTGNTKNTIAAGKEVVHGGTYSLAWSPIGWNVKDDGTVEDAGTFILNKCRKAVDEGATAATLSGFANTEKLDPKHKLMVALANETFGTVDVKTMLDGGAKGWQPFKATIPLKKSDNAVIVAFSVTGTKGVGAPDSAVYLDDLTFAYTGGSETSASSSAEAPNAEAAPAGPRPFLMGFTPFAWDQADEIAARSQEFVTTFGDVLCHHFDGGVPWTEALDDQPFPEAVRKDWETRKARTPEGEKVYLALTPLGPERKDMAGYRGEKENMPLPPEFAGKRLNDPLVEKAYLNYCRRATEFFQPDYLAIGIEVNEFLHKAPEQWEDFLALYGFVRSELKKTYPGLPIFASVTLHNLLNKGWADMQAQQDKIRAFLPENDIVGVSFYSFFATLGSIERPTEVFDWLRDFAGGKPVAVCETGFPAEPTEIKSLNVRLPGTLDGQRAYYETLFQAAERDNYLFIVTFLYRDYDALWEKIKSTMPDWAMAWKDIGLLDEKGEARPAWLLYKEWFDRKYARPAK